jgi:DNA polymerase III subunit epsilon
MTPWLIVLVIVALAYFLLRPQSKTKSIDMSILPPQFVVVDLETTGLDPEKHEIIEIGAVKVNRDSNTHATLQALIKIDKKVPKKITEITGITTEMLERDGEPLEVAFPQFLEFVGDLRLVFFNAPFDVAFLSRAAARFDKKIENPVSCALDMARRAWPGQKSYKLESLARTAGFSTTGTHRALKDCELTITVYGAAAVKLGRVQ